ncbi:MAG: transposase [Anaerolineae bacterium]|nr:transposase [Gloeobacterales cyanobacterium ES-bin-313]
MATMNFEYRLYPTADQAAEMLAWLDICKRVYNYALAERRDWIASRKCRINACSLKHEYIIPVDTPYPDLHKQSAALTRAKKTNPELKIVDAQVLQQILRQVDGAFVNMQKRGGGFPRFKKRLKSFCFPQFKTNPIGIGTIKLPHFKYVRIVMHRPIPEGFTVKQVRIVKKASGWYAVVAIQSEVVLPTVQPHGFPIGIDVGLNHFVATSEGELVERPKFFVDSQHKLKKLNRRAAKKQKGSKNQLKAFQKVARHHEHVANQRKQYHYAIAHKLCDQAGMLFAESLNIKGMASGMLAKHILDAGWSQFLSILAWVCKRRGVYFAKVSAYGSSQECPECGSEVCKDLSVRMHDCPECDYIAHRDVATSQVVRNRGLAALGIGVREACGGNESTRPKKQEILNREVRMLLAQGQ